MAKKDPALELILSLLLRLTSPLKSIPVQTADGVVFIRPERVAYMTFDNQRLVIREIDGSTWHRFDSLTDMEKRLAEDPRFFRSHRSYIVNLHAVRSMIKSGSKEYRLTFNNPDIGDAGLAQSKLSQFRELMELQ
jgi:DNA-binding LytR/AlgR family response regulator